MYRIVLLAALFVLGACSQVTPPGAGETTGLQPAASGVKGAGTQVAVSQKLGAVFVVGDTEGSLDGPHKGREDVFLRRYNRDGTLAWRTQIGGTALDSAAGVAVDQNGNVYVGTSKTATGTPYTGNLYKYNSVGKQLWVRRYLNTDAKPAYDGDNTYSNVYPVDVGVDSANNVYVIGDTSNDEFYIRKYGSDGSLKFFKRFALGSLQSTEAATVDSRGNSYVSTYENTDNQPRNYFYKISSSGDLVWKQVLEQGRATQSFHDLEVVGNALYGGGTKVYWYSYDADDYISDYDAYIAKYTLDGEKLWGKTLGTSKPEVGDGLSVDAQGNVYLTGRSYSTQQDMYDNEYERTGWYDLSFMFVQKLTANGNTVWNKQFDSKTRGRLNDVSAYNANEIYVTGELGEALPNSTYNSGVLTARLDGSGRTVWLDQ